MRDKQNKKLSNDEIQRRKKCKHLLLTELIILINMSLFENLAKILIAASWNFVESQKFSKNKALLQAMIIYNSIKLILFFFILLVNFMFFCF